MALVRGYHGDSNFVAGEAFDATPANIDARTQFATLPNGMRVSLLSKKTRGGQVVGRLVLRLGTEQSLTGRAEAGEMAADMLDRGTATLTRQQLKDSLDRLKARVGVGGSARSVTFTIQTVQASVPAVLALVSEMARKPRFDSVEFEQLRQEQLADLEQNKSRSGGARRHGVQPEAAPEAGGQSALHAHDRGRHRDDEGCHARADESRSTPISTAPPRPTSC